jgi:hypothetical protein
MPGAVSRRCLLQGALLSVTGLAGCALFDKPVSALKNSALKLPLIGLPPDAIQLDVVYVERPAGDTLLGPELWRHVDQIGSIEPEQRTLLRKNGFRVGVVASNPPLPLQRMLGLTSDFAYEPAAEKSKQLVGHRCVLRSGGQTDIQASPAYPECTFEITQGGESRRRTYENALCKYHVTAERLQDGWVQLDFVPTVHHGQEQLRRVVGDAGWQFHTAQRTETLYPQRFSLRLSVGEMAVVTADEEADGTLGRLFFLGPDDEPQVQRLLVVRLAGMNDAEPHAKAK